MTRPRLLDLFCGAGGAAVGYSRAGFDVVGVDINPQPHYPFEFWQWDALDAALAMFAGFDVIHASPPCQAHTRAGKLRDAQGGTASEPDMIEPTRAALRATGLPYVMENVEGAPMANYWLILCGSSFGLQVRRHRLFESNMMLMGLPCRHAEQGRPVGVYHRMADEVPHGGRTARTLAEGQEAMGIDWMTWNELRLAIPPAYTEWIGRQLVAQLEVAA